MNKADLEKLADTRHAEVTALLAGGNWPGAYYLAGYAVECALKACIAGLFKSEVFPEKNFASSCYIHDLERLVALAGLRAQRDTHAVANPIFSGYWGTVTSWNEQSRYALNSQTDAEELLKAIDDPNDGVLQWIKSHW